MVVQRQAVCRPCCQRNLHHFLPISPNRVELMVRRETLLTRFALVQVFHVEVLTLLSIVPIILLLALRGALRRFFIRALRQIASLRRVLAISHLL